MLYQWFIRPFLYLLQPETAHGLIISLLRVAQFIPGMKSLLALVFRTPDGIGVDALGMHFPSPIGLAAGFDKDAEVYPALGAIGFGFIEVGTLTGEGQPGNPRPRLFRLVNDRALLNRMGFNNHGAEHAAQQLAKRGKGRAILGINIGKTKKVAAEDAMHDYEKSARLLGPYADYMVVNVSSPNTPGLRDLQAVESLRPILEVTRRALDETVSDRRVPLLVKIAPDLSDEDVLAVGDLALELGLDGIIATNTTISRQGLTLPQEEVEALGAGGVSGAPLKRRALDVLRLLRERTGGQLVLIAAGGIETAADAWDRLRAGADLVQVYSAMIYEGAALPSKMARGLGARMKQEGVHSLRDVIGADI